MDGTVWRVRLHPSNMRVYTTHSTNVPFFRFKIQLYWHVFGIKRAECRLPSSMCIAYSGDAEEEWDICKERSTNFPCALLELLCMPFVGLHYIPGPRMRWMRCFFFHFKIDKYLLLTSNGTLCLWCSVDSTVGHWAHTTRQQKIEKQIKMGGNRTDDRSLVLHFRFWWRTFPHSPVAYCICPANGPFEVDVCQVPLLAWVGGDNVKIKKSKIVCLNAAAGAEQRTLHRIVYAHAL